MISSIWISLCAVVLWIVPGCQVSEKSAPDGQIRSQPLADRTGSHPTLFRRLSPEESGVEFTNALEAENMRKYLYNGAGVAIGDYDGDGRPDLYLVSLDGPNRLFEQRGGMQFEDVTAGAGVDGGDAWGTGATFTDVDNDGNLDLFVCNLASPNLLYMNRGDGTFVETAGQAGVDYKGGSTMGAFADYDRDGDLDLYLLTNRVFYIGAEFPEVELRRINGQLAVHPDYKNQYIVLQGRYLAEAGESDILYRNNGDGTFSDVSEQAGIEENGMGLSATWWDYNDDGWLDVYVGNDKKTPDYLFRNNGDGSFTDVIEAVVPHTPWFSMGADFADINNDGLFDFLVGDMSSTTHFKQKTTMGAMSKSAWFLDSAVPRQYMRNALYLNTGTNRFMEVAYLTGLASTDWTWAVRFADLNTDGLADVFITNGTAKNSNNSDLLEEWEVLFSSGRLEEAEELALNLPPLLEENLAFENLGDLRFENTSAEWGLNLYGVSQGAAFADFDRDGDLDLVVNNLNSPVAVYRNEGRQGHRVLIRLEGAQSNRLGVGAKATLETGAGIQVGQLSLARGYMSADEPLLHFGLGEWPRIERLTVEWPSGAVQRFEDLAADRMYTIGEPRGADRENQSPPALAEAPSDRRPQFEDFTYPGRLNFVHSEQPYDDYEREPLLPYKLSQLGPGLAWGDADGDGDDDLYAGGAAGQAGALFHNARGEFKKMQNGPWEEDKACEDMAPLWFDADADGDLDLYVVSGGNEAGPGDAVFQDRLYINSDGSGSFQRAPRGALPVLTESGSAAAASDFDRDGDLDLFVGSRMTPGKYPLTPRSFLLRNEGGEFRDATDSVAPDLRRVGLVTGAVWSDATGDGWTDLLVTLAWSPIRVFGNRGGELVDATEASGLLPYSGWWNGIAAGDIDSDGDLDYVATNAGRNTKYHPTADTPVAMYARDFDNSGTLDLVETEFEGETEFPIRGLSCSAGAMPFVGEKFQTYTDFGKASIGEIYTEEELQRARRLDLNFLDSAALINTGGGVFEIRALPRLAQASAGFGVAVTDLDADGHLDVYMTQNFFSPQRETGQWDGGLSLMLRGAGDGMLTPAWPTESGFVVPGDAKGGAVADFDGDGWPDVAVAINDGQLRIFRNTGVTGNKPLTVRLKGPSGNPTGVGALVRLTTRSGRVQTQEVLAGSGYLSQSSSRLFFGLGESDPPVEIRVRWSDGSTTLYTENLDQQSILLEPL